MTNKITPLLGLSGFMFFLLPWYVTKSGRTQPVDIIILMLFAIFLTRGFPQLPWVGKNSLIYRSFLYFSLYSIIVFLINFIIGMNEITANLILQNIYYIILVTTFVLLLFNWHKKYGADGFYKIALYMLILDSLLPLAVFAGLNSYAKRVTLTFNDPNQLGFYALVNLSIFLYITLLAKERKIPIKRLLSICLININLLFLFLSASRACYLSIILYVASGILILTPGLRGYNKLLVYFLGGIASLLGMLYVGHALYQHMLEVRPAHITMDYAGLVADIYYRSILGITNNLTSAKLFLLGSGDRSGPLREGTEFHNNFFSVFNQLGFIGFILFCFMNVVIIKQLFKKGWIYLLPIICYLFYSMFNYSYRTRVNWLFLAFLIFMTTMDKLINLREMDRKA